MYCPHQYLSTDPKECPQTAHKLQKFVSMNADISETIKDSEASLSREYATPTNRQNLWRPQFLC